MKKSRFTDQQIAVALQQGEQAPVSDPGYAIWGQAKA